MHADAVALQRCARFAFAFAFAFSFVFALVPVYACLDPVRHCCGFGRGVDADADVDVVGVRLCSLVLPALDRADVLLPMASMDSNSQVHADTIMTKSISATFFFLALLCSRFRPIETPGRQTQAERRQS